MSRGSKIVIGVFAVVMIANGGLDLSAPTAFRAAMDALGMPHYLLTILGFAKIAGGLTILLPAPLSMKECAFAGFFIWFFGAIASHLLSGEGLSGTFLLFGLGGLLVAAFTVHHRSRTIQNTVRGDT